MGVVFWTIILIITHAICAAVGAVWGIGFGEDKANRAAASPEVEKWRARSKGFHPLDKVEPGKWP